MRNRCVPPNVQFSHDLALESPVAAQEPRPGERRRTILDRDRRLIAACWPTSLARGRCTTSRATSWKKSANGGSA